MISVLLFLLAFPGISVVVAVVWMQAARRYQDHMKRVASYPDPSIDEVLDRGIVGTYRGASIAASRMDEAARSGSLGSEAQRLQALERRWFVRVAISIPVAMGVSIALGGVVRELTLATDRTSDTVAISALLLAAYVGIAIVASRSVFALWRRPRGRALAGLYLVGLIVLGVGAVFGLTRLLA